MAVSRAKTGSTVNRINQMTLSGPSPEKAGVGGSIPSLATTFSKHFQMLYSGFGSNWFQFQPADTVSRDSVRRFTEYWLRIFI
jgi:hypothetical protein